MKFEQQFSQQQKQTQKLAMTQKLQQSIQVLQFSTEELSNFIDNQALENPLLDVTQPNYTSNYSKPRTSTGTEMNRLNQIPDTTISLFEHLIDQIHLNYRDTYLRTLVLYLVEYIDLNGYLTISLDEAVAKTGGTPIQLLDALTLIQQLEPAGVGARNLQECLMLQTERDNYAPEIAYLLLEEYFIELVERKWDSIAKKLLISLADVQKVFDYIQTLTPAPGAIFGSTEGLYIIPDLTVKVEEQQVTVFSNRSGMPEIKFQQNYFEQMKQSGDPDVLKYLKDKQQDFEWLKKTVEQRGDTIFNVGKAIVERQQEFFLNKEHPIKPLILKDISEELAIHESTVSRAVNGKYLETDFGVFELKHFFSQKLASDDGERSTNDVKHRLQALVDAENKAKPLSDQKLVDLLNEEGIDISRRTVAKYRDLLKIPSSAKRKRYDEA
ncbi:RNA polymerase factor sigma-54 [Enterococcus saccharolyticus]|uniref:RNA polymerase sigma-54 factor n=1 Tax=Enterococcus saccharolyticus subsp. saccharolyticus ATCC 43076 TaxID=1139996 RepID=S0NVS7_9ENTE|nr:RNA polymerase factor sigma-54 [Enterococcus saccharolyticus]EOT30062.1 RNA polymerase sigma-54 factor [Enterococcus saccharolyticus subsp. saccharolyticus ATCC 43076]EOT80608.1 RNA polymerase sigma-54 factor [Enterococcus saccharolyticus subsp. saccharolyticus ATCC 43076]OJG90147.1 RNA polymerase sigma-54 factor [Enterococcus saccharolyticus]